MLIVDSHVHASEHWFEPVETLLSQMDRNNVKKAILIPYAGNYDNRYQFECVRRYPGRFGAVVHVDPQRPDALDSLDILAKEGAIGVRTRPYDIWPGLILWRYSARPLNLAYL